MNVSSTTTACLDCVDEDTLAATVSDEALEAAGSNESPVKGRSFLIPTLCTGCA